MKKVCLFLLLITAACSIYSDVSVLDNSTCELPCWNGIVPGMTSKSDALQIIEKLNGVDIDKTIVTNVPWKAFNEQIRFYMYTDPSLTKEHTDGEIYFIDDKVAAILLLRNINRTFSEMIVQLGEPSFIITLPLQGAVVQAIFPAKGVALAIYADSDELIPSTKIDDVMFFDSIQYETLLDADMFSLGRYDADETKIRMHPWVGYGSIQELYPPIFP